MCYPTGVEKVWSPAVLLLLDNASGPRDAGDGWCASAPSDSGHAHGQHPEPCPMSSDGRPPSFQLYPRDLLTSRTVLAMTPAGRGAYLFLLCHAWLSDDPGALPDDRSLLAALAGMAPDQWREVENEVLAAFRHTDRGYVQDRLRGERAAQRKRFQRSVQGGWLRSNGARDSKGRYVPTSPSTGLPPLASASASAVKDKEKDSDPSLASGSSNGIPDPTPVGVQGPVAIAPGRRKDGPPDEEYFAGLGARIKP